MATHSTSTPLGTFAHLPREIRDKIWSHVLPSPHYPTSHSPPSLNSQTYQSLTPTLLTSRRINAELTPLRHRIRTLTFHIDPTSTLGPRVTAHHEAGHEISLPTLQVHPALNKAGKPVAGPAWLVLRSLPFAAIDTVRIVLYPMDPSAGVLLARQQTVRVSEFLVKIHKRRIEYGIDSERSLWAPGAEPPRFPEVQIIGGGGVWDVRTRQVQVTKKIKLDGAMFHPIWYVRGGRLMVVFLGLLGLLEILGEVVVVSSAGNFWYIRKFWGSKRKALEAEMASGDGSRALSRDDNDEFKAVYRATPNTLTRLGLIDARIRLYLDYALDSLPGRTANCLRYNRYLHWSTTFPAYEAVYRRIIDHIPLRPRWELVVADDRRRRLAENFQEMPEKWTFRPLPLGEIGPWFFDRCDVCDAPMYSDDVGDMSDGYGCSRCWRWW